MSSRRNFEKTRRASGSSSSSVAQKRKAAVFVGILTISDRCSSGEKCDLSGPNLQKIVQEHDGFRSVVKAYKIVPDEEDQIANTLKNWSDDLGLELVITTGGTGIGPRDVTPEATASVIDKETPGFTIAIITASLKVTPDAMTTRLKCGIRGSTLIINVPGSKKASSECLNVVLPAIPHALECLSNQVGRMCSCASVEDYPNVRAVKRKSSVDKNDRPREDQNQPGGKSVCCRNGEHALTYKPATVISVSEDGRGLTDVDIDSILSAEEGTLTLSSSASQNQVTTLTSTPINRTVRIDAGSPDCGTLDEAILIINDTVNNLGAEEGPIIDAFGKILAEDIRVQESVAVNQNSPGNNEIRTTNADGFSSNLLDDGSIQPGLRNKVSNSRDNILVKNGTLVTAYQIGLFAAQGLSTCRTFKTPVVGVLSIGEKDKIIANHVTSQIHLQQNSVKLLDLGITGHNWALLPEVFRSSMSKADIIVVISTLEACREMASSLLAKIFGAKLHFSSLSAVTREKSYFMTTNRNEGQNLFFIVPENPAGSAICSLALIPSYRKLAGYQEIRHRKITAEFPQDKDLREAPEYLQCKVTGQQGGAPAVETFISNEKNSGRQFQYGINALAVLPARDGGRNSIRKRDNVDVLMIDVNNGN